MISVSSVARVQGKGSCPLPAAGGAPKTPIGELQGYVAYIVTEPPCVIVVLGLAWTAESHAEPEEYEEGLPVSGVKINVNLRFPSTR
jgi:hypothetical protein